jgi:hypothetical protein
MGGSYLDMTSTQHFFGERTMTNLANVPANRIVKYVVRVAGNTAWSEHRTEKAAKRECEKANRTCRPGHRVFAQHANGDVTGPY